MKNANTTCLIGKPLDRDLGARLGRAIRIANDANCFALSEASDGAAAGHRVVFGVIMGTGVGGGVVIDGRLVEGANRVTGEWGHNPLPWRDASDLPGPACYCGKHGCIETYLSGPGLARDHLEHAGRRIDARQLDALADSGDTAAAATLLRCYERLARALALVVNILDPDVIVLGGGVSRLDRLCEETQKRLKTHTFSDPNATLIRAAAHGDASGVRGAAWLWPPPSR